MNIHTLPGCTPTPLGSYLKALGVLRLIAEQADPEARGFWRADRFALATTLDEAGLLDFFLHDYAPTPLLSPWNGGSGFYPKDNTTGLDAILASTTTRFEPFRQAIRAIQAELAGRSGRPDSAEKAAFLRRCRNQWSDGQLPWMNAALAVLGDDVAFPALLGTGGNDGRLDFTNNYMQRLAELLLTSSSAGAQRGLLRASLFDDAVTGLEKNAVGQFLPGSAGGMNSGPGFEGPSIVNPWDFVLMLEGATAIQVAVVRQLDSAKLPVAAAPFAFRSRAAGYGSAARSEESARGEQWFPLWERPLTLPELQALFREGRMQTGGRRATGAIDAAKAIAGHGTSRGITAFQRFGYIERNGLSNFAVPLGRWRVSPSDVAPLIGQVEAWVDQLRRASRDPVRDPESLRRHVRNIESRMLSALKDARSTGRARALQSLLIALGQAEHGLVQRPKHTASQGLRPLTGLSHAWLEAMDDGTPELRLAAAFATQWSFKAAHVRAHTAPLAKSRFRTGPTGLLSVPEVCWTGRNLVDDLVAIVLRRLATAETGQGLDQAPTYGAPVADVHAFVLGRTDDERLAGLARGLLALRKAPREVELRTHDERVSPLPAYALVRSAFPGREIPDSPLRPSRDNGAARQLANGRSLRASTLLVRRLVGLGVRTRLHHFVHDRATCRRLLASLMFPLSNASARNLLRGVSFSAPLERRPGGTP